MRMNKFTTGCSIAAVTLLCAAPGQLSAQARSGAEGWSVPRTSAGHPVLQGYWTNTTVVPFERPAELGEKAFYTQEEADALLRAALAASEEETQPGTTEDVHYQFDDYGLSRAQNPVAYNLRTSILTDPPNGRMPPLTPEAERAAAEIRAWRAEHGFDSVKERSLSERCILWSNEGPPMIPLGYNSNLQIVQTATHVVVLMEMIHDARIIPLRDTPPDNIHPQWLGNSWGRWEGDTLVVETTGFTGRTTPRGTAPIAQDAHVTERFTRTGPDTILYQFTMNDPTVWQASWSGEYPITAIEGPMFEYACHEGNYGLPNNLSGARAEERRARGE